MLKFNNNIMRNLYNSGLGKVRLRQQHLSNFQEIAPTVGNFIGKWTKTFENNSISEPQESAENIIMHCLNIRKFPDLYKCNNRQLSDIEIDCINTLCNRRLKHEPIQYIIGEWTFRNLIIKMSPPVFIPRPETELLVDLILNEIDRKQCKHLLELCCGSGAISLSLLAERADLKIIAIDKSQFACNLTETNVKSYNYHKRIEIIHHNLDGNKSTILPFQITQKFDIIVSNPPYIQSDLIRKLQPEIIMYEDLDALDGGGVDGLNLIKTILMITTDKLNVGGKLFLEVDPTQPTLIHNWIIQNYPGVLDFTAVYKDYYGKNRFVEITKL